DEDRDSEFECRVSRDLNLGRSFHPGPTPERRNSNVEKPMQRLTEILFGIDAPSWTAGGRWRLEWLAMPDGDRMLLLLAGLVVAAGGLWWLYRWEGRHLGAGIRSFLMLVRLCILLLIAAM